ncbi:hypothetical protein [Actinoplanes rectilineatus]|uniref:hypothetical protein n=1 Tax=Actinoplanes rectilineatus TaxID=113571 RepID=UPI000A6E4B0F|nr:hypothetical protein [Actinoplanes rectilineatus]
MNMPVFSWSKPYRGRHREPEVLGPVVEAQPVTDPEPAWVSEPTKLYPAVRPVRGVAAVAR